jgi:hypothetical protein
LRRSDILREHHQQENNLVFTQVVHGMLMHVNVPTMILNLLITIFGKSFPNMLKKGKTKQHDMINNFERLFCFKL